MRLLLITAVLAASPAWAGRLTGNANSVMPNQDHSFDQWLYKYLQQEEVSPAPFAEPPLTCPDVITSNEACAPPTPSQMTFAANGALDSITFSKQRVLPIAGEVAIAADAFRFVQREKLKAIKFKGHVLTLDRKHRQRFSGFYDLKTHRLCAKGWRKGAGYCGPAEAFFGDPSA